ncbi:MAG: hypothetical protein IH951_11685 [Bacteroidetes bacterium]|nr:hypothetical protein [Bacteroidota bacterium]
MEALEALEQAKGQVSAIIQKLPIERQKDVAGDFSQHMTDLPGYIEECSQLAVSDEHDTETMDVARSWRLRFKTIRNNIESTRKRRKKVPLLECQAVDGVANILKALIIPFEERMERIENHAQIVAATNRNKMIDERLIELQGVQHGLSRDAIGEMEADVFTNMVATLKAGVEAGKKAEQDELNRVAEAQETERDRNLELQSENDRLKKEQDEINQQKADDHAKEQQILHGHDYEKLDELIRQLDSIQFPACESSKGKAVTQNTKSYLKTIIEGLMTIRREMMPF